MPMPHGCRGRRTASTFAGIVLALTSAAGCERLAVSHLQTSAPPAGDAVGPRPVTSYTTTTPQYRPQASPAVPTPPEPRPQLSADPAPAPAPTSAPTPVGSEVTLAPATPLLDEALQRVEAIEKEASGPGVAEIPTSDPAPIPAEPASPIPTSVPPAGDGAPSEPAAAPPVRPEPGATSGVAPGRDPGATPEPLPPAVLAEATPVLPPDSPKAGPRFETAATLVGGDGTSPGRPIDPERPEMPQAPPRDDWREYLERLRSVARDRSEAPGGAPPDHDLWLSRCKLLDYLDGPEGRPKSEGDALRETFLTVMAAATGTEASPHSTPIRAAVEVLEGHAPLEILDMQLCRKVRGFGDFDSLEASACRPGHALILYCEVGGLAYAPEGPQYRSRLASRVEIATPGGEPVWSQPLGTAEDVCRRRRRDFYVNYRVTLPDTIAPGTYELRLFQEDLVANHSAAQAIPLVIQP